MSILKDYFLEKLHKKILKDLGWKSDYEGLKLVYGEDVENEFSFRNNRCHQNALDVWKKKKYMEVKLCFTREKGVNYGFIHFINYNTKTGKYFDNTLGSASYQFNHYILNDNWIKEQLKLDTPKPISWLNWAKKDLYSKYCTNWLWKLFIKVDDM